MVIPTCKEFGAFTLGGLDFEHGLPWLLGHSEGEGPEGGCTPPTWSMKQNFNYFSEARFLICTIIKITICTD